MVIFAAKAGVGDNPILLAPLPVVLSLSWNSVCHIVASVVLLTDDCKPIWWSGTRRGDNNAVLAWLWYIEWHLLAVIVLIAGSARSYDAVHNLHRVVLRSLFVSSN